MPAVACSGLRGSFWVGCIAGSVAACVVLLLFLTVFYPHIGDPDCDVEIPGVYDLFGNPDPLLPKAVAGACVVGRPLLPPGCQPLGVYYFNEDSMGLALAGRCDVGKLQWPWTPPGGEGKVVYHPWGLETAAVVTDICSGRYLLPCDVWETIYLFSPNRARVYVLHFKGVVKAEKAGVERVARSEGEELFVRRFVTSWLLEEGARLSGAGPRADGNLLASYFLCNPAATD